MGKRNNLYEPVTAKDFNLKVGETMVVHNVTKERYAELIKEAKQKQKFKIKTLAIYLKTKVREANALYHAGIYQVTDDFEVIKLKD